MAVKRIVANFSTKPSVVDGEQIKTFYKQVLDLKIVMDQGWIFTFASDQMSHP